MDHRILVRSRSRAWCGAIVALGSTIAATLHAAEPAAAPGSPAIIHRVQASSDRVEMTVNESRILTMELRIPRVQVNNPELLDITPLSATQVQVHAKKTGVTQVNLWDERNQIHAIDVIINGDVRDLARLLQSQFPSASIKVFPTPNSVILSGYVDRADQVSRMVRMAEDYYPKVINNITVGGAQQVLLHVKVMEVSRTKLRDMGFDFANISGGGTDYAASGISGLLGALTRDSTTGAITTVGAVGAPTFTFGIVDPSNSFFGILRALQRNSLMKVLAEPTLVTVSGRPAYFQAGGEIPVLIPQGLGTVAVEYRRFGTQVDFVPVVIGNGSVRLEVRPRVSELDNSIAVNLNGTTVPGFRTREVDTGVELKAGQTLALAGLIQTRVESQKSGVPWLGDLPYVGVPFRRVIETNNEVELLIMVRPEVAEGLEPEEVPACGPGQSSVSPSNWDLYMRGYIEVPKGHPDVAPKHHGGMGAFTPYPDGAGPGPGPVYEEVPAEDVPAHPVPPAAGMNRSSGSYTATGTTGASRTTSTRGQASAPASSAASLARRTTPAAAATSTNRQNPSSSRNSSGSNASPAETAAPGVIGPIGYEK